MVQKTIAQFSACVRKPRSVFGCLRCLIPLLVAGSNSLIAIEAQDLPTNPVVKRPHVAVVLSGGGARGGAHIGVLRELERMGVPIDLIVGSSYGAFIGGLYAVGYSTEDLELIIKSIRWNEVLSNTLDRRLLNFNNKYRSDRRLLVLEGDRWDLKLPKGLQTGFWIQQLLDRLTVQVVLDAENDFDKLPVRFRAVATDVLTGEAYVFRNGSLSTAIRSSIAAPGLLTPVELGNTLLIDGGIANVLPIDIALAEGADVVIAVDVSTPLRNRKEQIGSLVDVLDQVAKFYSEQKKQSNLKNATIVIAPTPEEFDFFDFSRSYLLIERGVNAVAKTRTEIDQQLEVKGIARSSSNRRTSLLNPATLDLDHFTLGGRVIVPREINVEGLHRYPPAYVLGQVSSRMGVPVSLETIDRDVSALYGTGLFDVANYQLSKDALGTRLTYSLHERSPVQGGVGLRYDQDYKFTGMIDLTDYNVLGASSDVAFRLIAGEATSAELGVNHRLAFGTALILSPQLHFRSQKRLILENGNTLGDYQDQRYGFRAASQYLLTRVGRIELAYLWERVSIDRGAADFAQSSNKSLAGLTVGVRFDTLDNADFPTLGALGKMEFEWRSRKVGSDFSFSRSIAELDHYFSLDSGTTVGLTANLGLVHGTAPFFARFYTGGTQNLHMASSRFLGLSRDEILSNQVGILGVSFRHPLPLFQSGMAKEIFLNLEYRAGFFSTDSARSRNPLHGFGIGLHFDIPFLGPVRLDLGRTHRSRLRGYFSVGHTF